MHWNKVKGDIEVSEFYLGGYSLGGTQAAFVAKMIRSGGFSTFRKVIMCQPGGEPL